VNFVLPDCAPVARLLNTAEVAAQLQQAKVRPQRAAAIAARLAKCASALPVKPSENGIAAFVPGRIEVLGKHTDYCGGRSLICAVESGFCFVAVGTEDSTITLVDVGNNAKSSFAVSADVQPVAGNWLNYPMTVARRLEKNFSEFVRGRGAAIAFDSDLPQAAGLSSSSAMIVGLTSSLIGVWGIHRNEAFQRQITTREDFAGYCGCIENGQSFGSLTGDKGVGTFGGSQDHTAILCCQPNRLAVYSFTPVKFEQDVPMPDGTCFVVIDSGVVAAKTGNALEKYNAVSLRARKILELWNQSTGRNDPTLAATVRARPGAIGQIERILPNSDLKGRLRQFLIESEMMIPPAVAALSRGDLGEFGRLAFLSQSGAQALLNNQVPQTITLVKIASANRAIAASAFGAGFGGAVWAMVPSADAEGFAQRCLADYRQQFPQQHARVLITQPGPGAIFL